MGKVEGWDQEQGNTQLQALPLSDAKDRAWHDLSGSHICVTMHFSHHVCSQQ